MFKIERISGWTVTFPSRLVVYLTINFTIILTFLSRLIENKLMWTVTGVHRSVHSHMGIWTCEDFAFAFKIVKDVVRLTSIITFIRVIIPILVPLTTIVIIRQ